MKGKAKYSWPDGSSYEGDVVNGKRSGEGLFTNSIGQTYEGNWLNGLKHGRGKQFYDKNRTITYDGCWELGYRNGYGVMTFENGNMFKGYWLKNKKHGRGMMMWKDKNEIYLGDWFQNQQHGKGEHIWYDGPSIEKPLWKQHCNLYRGDFANRMRHGRGTFFYSDGSQYTGQWENNEKHGEGLFINANGDIQVNQFDHNHILSNNIPITHSIQLLSSTTRSVMLPQPNSSIMSPSANQNKSKQLPIPPTSDEVNPQYRINVDDILLEYSLYLSIPLDDLNDYLILETKEIERLLLRYHSYIQESISLLRQQVNDSKTSNNNFSFYDWKYILQPLMKNYEDDYTSDQCQFEMKMYFERLLYEKNIYSCRYIDIIKLFIDLHIIDYNKIFTSYDLKNVLMNMKAYNQQQIYKLQEYHRSELKVLSNPSSICESNSTNEYNNIKGLILDLDSCLIPSIQVIESNEILQKAKIQDFFLFQELIEMNKIMSVDIIDPRYPLSNHDFISLLVRCISYKVMKDIANGKVNHPSTTKMYLSSYIFQTFAQEVSIFILIYFMNNNHLIIDYPSYIIYEATRYLFYFKSSNKYITR